MHCALFLGIHCRQVRRGRQHVGCGQIAGFLKIAARDGSSTVAKVQNLGIRVAFPTSCPARAGRYGSSTKANPICDRQLVELQTRYDFLWRREEPRVRPIRSSECAKHPRIPGGWRASHGQAGHVHSKFADAQQTGKQRNGKRLS